MQRDRPAKVLRASAAISAAPVISSSTASWRAVMAETFPSGRQSQSLSLLRPAGVEQASIADSKVPLVSPLLVSSTYKQAGQVLIPTAKHGQERGQGIKQLAEEVK